MNRWSKARRAERFAHGIVTKLNGDPEGLALVVAFVELLAKRKRAAKRKGARS